MITKTQRTVIWITVGLVVLWLLSSKAYGQVARDTAHYRADTALARKLTNEATRKDSRGRALAPRATVIRTLADSLRAQARVWWTRPITPPPDTVIPVPDPVVPPPPPGDSLTGINPPALPSAPPQDVSAKPCIRTIDVSPPADLQSAISGAQSGDCLDLAQRAEWKGNFVLPVTCPAGSAWITIRTKGIVDKPGVRLTRAEASVLAKITSPNSDHALSTPYGSCRWNLNHLNIQEDVSFAGVAYGLIALGDNERNSSMTLQPKDFILRRNWIHGQPTSNLVRCVTFNGIRMAAVDNIIEDCHIKGFDSQAIAGWNGAGPFLIENNFLAGAGENVMFGGGDPAVPGLRPSDIIIRRNHFYKDPMWKGLWTIKNLFELKNARRVLLEANVFENSWPGEQQGAAIVLKSSTDACSLTQPPGSICRQQGTTDITFRHNLVKNTNRGVVLQSVDDAIAGTGTDIHTARVVFEQNLFLEVGTSNGISNDGWLIYLTGDLKDVLFRRNTMVCNTPGACIDLFLANPGMGNLRLYDNVLAGQSYYAIAGDNTGAGMIALNAKAPGGWSFSGNIVSVVDAGLQAMHPPNNTYLTLFSQVGAQANGATSYPTKGGDVATINQKTSGVVITSLVASRLRAAAPRQRLTLTQKDLEWLARQPKG